MQNILSLEGSDNIGNIFQFRFLPVIDAESIPAPAGFAIPQPVVLKSGKSWYMGSFSELTADYKLEGLDSSNGKYTRFLFSCNVPKVSKSMSNNFDEMKDHRFLLDMYDANGNRKLIGSIADGASFKYEESPGKGSAYNGYQISFYAEAISIYNYEDAASLPGGGGGGGA